jgi:hypothetical protein
MGKRQVELHCDGCLGSQGLDSFKRCPLIRTERQPRSRAEIGNREKQNSFPGFAKE